MSSWGKTFLRRDFFKRTDKQALARLTTAVLCLSISFAKCKNTLDFMSISFEPIISVLRNGGDCMNKRGMNLLNDILSSERLTVECLAKKYMVTQQTIKNDIKDINDWFQHKTALQMKIDSQDAVCLVNRSDIPSKEQLDALFKQMNLYVYKLSGEERKTILMILLLMTLNTVKLAELTEHLGVSKNTILGDLQTIKKRAAMKDMVLVSSNRGYCIEGEEFKKRKAIEELLLVNVDRKRSNTEESERYDFFKSYLMTLIDQQKVEEVISRIIVESEKEEKVLLTDFSFSEVLIKTVIQANRIAQNKILTNFRHIDSDYLKSSKYNLGKRIYQKLNRYMLLDDYREELAYLVTQLRNQRYLKNNGKNSDMIDISLLINELLYNISKKLKINYYLDYDFYNFLIQHVKLAAFRIRNNEELTNPYTEEILNKYTKVYQIIKDNLDTLEAHIKGRFSDDEISFLVMYIVAMMEKNKKDDIIVNVLLSCGTGGATAYYMKTRLESFSEKINVVDIVPARYISSELTKDIDLIISNQALEYDAVPVVKVNTMIDESDFYLIMKIVNEILLKKSRKIKVNKTSFHEKMEMKEILSPKAIAVVDTVKDWKEAIELSGQLLLKNGKIEAAYIPAMIDNVLENGPYIAIYPGVAIPHAESIYGAVENAASILILKNPVPFGNEKNDPINIVFALSITDPIVMEKALYDLFKILSEESMRQKLLQLEDEASIYSYMIDKIKKEE